MTQNQLDWMQDNGLDPVEYDMTPDGRVLRKQAAVAQEPEREVMSMPRAFGTSFLGNLVPSAASIAGAAAGMKGGAALGAFGGPVGAAIGGGIGGIGGGLGAGYLAGKGQQALLENYAPEAAAEMQRAETDQPVMSYLGGFAPNALTMSPSVKGLSGLLRPTVRGEETLRAALTNPNFLNPAINVGANVAGSTAGQLVNMSEGGEFSAPRFAADVALGTLFNKPTGFGKRLGFSDIPENVQEAPGDLAKSRDRAELMANVPKEFATPRAERGSQDIAKPGVNIGLEAPDQYFTAEGKPLTEKAYAADYSKWWKSETEPTTELLKAKAEEVKAKIPRDKLKELSNDPEVGEVLRDPSKMEAFVAKQADQTLEDVFQMMESRKAEEISRTEEASKAQQMQAEKARVEAEQNAIEIQKLQDLEASQALTDEAAARLQVLKSRRAELLYANKDQGPVQLKNIREQSDPAIAQAQKEVADARAIAEDIWTRLQRPEGKQSNKITQEDINLATELANRRGLKVQLDRAFAGSQEVRGMYLVDKNTGDRIIRINPLMATADTAIHEIGHDIFKGVTNKGMRRSLMDTALDSPAYKAELAARAEEVKAGKITQEQANDIALEEGLVQAFGEKMPDINRGELRAWFSAFKASMKQLVTGKMSPEDALAWMHYATTENVPWKGVATAKTSGQERLQRGEKPPELEALNAQLKQAQEAERDYKQQNPYDREGIKALEADSKKAMNAYFEKSQAYEEANPKYPGIENAPEFLPSEDKYYRSFQDPADDQTGLRHMAQGKIWPDAFVMEIESPRGVIDANNNALRGRFKPEQVTKIIHDVDSFEPYPHDYIAELKRKYPNAEIVDGVLNDREDGYRILGPAKSEPSADSSDIRYQRAQQETPEFKNWFGESKVVDAEGKPLTVYHGTRSPQDFNTFRTDSGHNYGPGAYFTPEARRASGYAGEQEGARVYSTYVSVEKPYTVQSDATIQDLGYKLRQDPANDALIQKLLQKYNSTDKNILGNAEVGNAWLREQGYDGIIKQRNRYTEDGYVPEVVEVVAFNPEQVKSATANKGSFDPLSKDIRYQRPTVGQAKDMAQETLNRVSKFAELDNLEARGGIHAVVAKAMKAFYATRSFMEGRPQAFEKAMYELSPERRVMLGKHIGQEFDQQRFVKPPSEIAAAYNEYRQEWQKFWPDEANKAGHTIRSAGGQRARLTDPYYGPFHMWNDNVRDIMTNKQGSPEYVKLQDDYIKQHVQAHQQRGIPLQEAQTRAAAEFADEVRTMSVPYDPTAAGTFAGARKAQGIPLPESWREYDIVKLIKSYDRRSAIDFAMQEHMEKSPEVMAALGAKTFFNDQPIPAQIKAAIPNISTDKSVQSILREMSGQPARKPDEVASGASRGISALTIGTVSKATEVPTTMIAGLRYLQMSDYLPGTMKFIEKLADWSALQERSYASGLNKRDASQNMRQVSGVAENAAGFLNKFAEGVSSVTGLNKLEQAARTMAQGWGEVLVQINKNKAATGDKDAVRMLDTLSPDWRTRSDADLAAQFGKLMQGSYDMTQLPAWMLESGAAPYLTWSKWSAGQYSNFVKFAIEPAMQGNVKPLIGHLLIGVMGGAAVDQIREWMNNREGRDVNWNELESWMQQNQGQLGAEGMKQLSVKLLNMVQSVGTFGIAGDLAKMVTTAAVGGSAQGMATAPVANAVFDTSKKVAAALKAIDDGEDFGLVLRQAMGDIAQTHIQVARVGRNWLDEQENLRYDDRRQRRLFDELTGAPTQAGTFSVNYGNLAERAFERGEITSKTGEEAFNLVSRARTEATSPEDYASRIRKLKTSQNAIMPSLDRQPQKAARYLGFVEGAEPGKGSETLKRYYTRQNEDKYRKSLIEGMSGIR
jgi:hypothetical protein